MLKFGMRAALLAAPLLSLSVAQAATPLVADAGASPQVVNDRVVLLGAGWGGAAPYRFSWQVDGAELENADRFAARLNVAGWQPGDYQAELKVTDSAGHSVSDTVRFRVPGALAQSTPLANAGGVYQFVTGEPQRLSGAAEGGRAPYQFAWDLDRDGQIDARGASIETRLPVGHHLVRLLVTDADGLESQQMTSVYVGSKADLADMVVPLTLIGMSDSGINPYHAEFSAETYPDPRVLELTQNFTRHPCEYISQFPCRAPAIPITLGEGYYPEQDQELFHIPSAGVLPYVQPGVWHWIPGTKIVGVLSNGGYDDPPADLIVDNNGHGTGSAGVAVGNRYGYCPSCLVYIVDSLDDTDVYGADFAEITTHSHGYVGNAPLGVTYLNDPADILLDAESKDAVERGVTVMFSAGNGVGNAFTVTNETYGSDQNGPAWTILVGALRRDTSGAIVGEGTPAHVSSWGDGWLPSACRTSTDSVCAHSGTSAASPYTAGVFGSVLRAARQALGDPLTGVREGQVIAEGTPIAGSPFLEDGKLTRRELRGVVLKTAASLDAQTSLFPYPVNTNMQGRYLFEGYGATTPNAALRAIEVLLGHAELPDRSEEDAFFVQDCELRDALYGSYDRDGDGQADTCAEDVASLAKFQGSAAVSNEAPYAPYTAAADQVARSGITPPLHYELHRTLAHEPYRTAADCGLPQTATEEDHQQFMSQKPDVPGDLEPCFDSRVTSTVAGFRPKGIFAADDVLTGALPAGSSVEAQVFVQSAAAGPVELIAYLSAGDRVIGTSAPVYNVTTAATWAEYNFSFSTDRIAVPGERLGVHFALTGQIEWAYGFEGDHASNVTITPAAVEGAPFGVRIDSAEAEGEQLRVTGVVAVADLGPDPELGNAGFNPVTVNVQLARSDDYSDAVWAGVDPRSGRFEALLPGTSAAGLVARAWRNRTVSDSASLSNQGERGADLPAGSAAVAPRGGALGGWALLLLAGLMARRVRRQQG